MQRRASVQGSRNKRSKSVLRTGDSKERRRSSIYAISSDEGSNPDSSEQNLFENIHLQKEVIQSVKLQTWPIRKKLKLLRQAKNYVARHEGALQERLAMSRSTRDLWARFKILMESRWRHWSREVASFLTTLIPWESRIKEIESHFGSGVASYFTFLRWLLSVNIMIAIPLVAFVIGPEYFSTIKNETDPRKRMTEHEFQVAGRLFTIWEFEGYLKYSPMFYGYYSSYSGASRLGYKLPLAYFLTSVLVYVYSFVATLKKMAQNSRNSKLSSKDDECIFSWKLFTGWDFMIGHSETAHNRLASVIVGFKEALLEEAERKKDNQNWRIILQRILVNILVTVLLAASGATVVKLVNESGKLAMQDNWLSRNAVNVTMTLLSFFLPMIFEALGFIEKWHPRQQLRLQLARIMMLNMLNLYSLMFSFIYNITSKEKPLQELKILNETATLEYEQLKNIIESIKSGATDIQIDFITMATNFWTDNSSFLGNDLLTTPATTSSTVSLTTAATLLGFLNYSKVINFVNGSNKSWINQTKTTTSTLPTTTTLAPTTTTRFSTSESNLWTSFLPLLTTTIQPDFSTWEDSSSGSEFLTTTTTAQTTIDSYEESTNISTDYWDYTDGDTTTSRAITTNFLKKDRVPPKLSNNVSYFYFHDYFAGFPLQDDQTLDFYEEQLETSTIHNNNSNNSNNNNKNNDDDDEDDEDEKRGKRQIYEEGLPTTRTIGTTTTTASPIIPIIVPPFRTSIYSRRKHSNLTTFSPLLLGLGFATTDPESQITTTTTTVPPTTTTTTTTTEIITTRTSPDTTTIMTTTTELTEATTILPTTTTTLTTTTTTPAPTTTTIMTTTSTTAPICRNETNTSTVAYKPKSTTVALTPLQRYERRLITVQKTLKEIQINLTSMCWETSLGQELSKVIVFDGVMGILVPLCIDLLRAVIVRYGNRNFCWDMEKTFPQYGDFKIAENILSLIYNQGQVWMGIFFSPGLVLINLVKLVIMMYFRSFIVLTCNVPHEVVFKASKSNNFYLTLLLTMLFLCVLPVGYAIVWLRPSWHCGPFSHYNRISEFITNTTRNALPKQLHEPLNYLTSSSTVIPLLLLLVLIIYYLVSLTGALREANQDLRTQLHKEREEERKKMFPVQESKQKMTVAALSSRWRKVLEVSSSANAQQRLAYEPGEYQFQSNKELLSRIVKNALRKGSATSEDDSTAYHVRGEDDTDNEHHDSLPADEEGKKKRLRLNKRKLRSERAIAEPTSPTSPTIDAEEHTRVLDERRQSLLNCKSQYEESTSATPAADITATNDFEVVDEKKSNRPLANVKNNSKEKGLFKSSLFKKSNANKSVCQPEKTEVSTVATMQNLTADHMNQFRTFSRASFKKFSTFMSLVRETVHANKTANEAAQVEEATSSKIVKTTDLPESSIEKSGNGVKAEEEPEEVTSVQLCVENSETVVGSEGDLVMKRNKILKSTSSNQIPTIMISMDSDDDMLYMHDIPSTTSGTQPVADGSANEGEIEEPRTADFIESPRASETN